METQPEKTLLELRREEVAQYGANIAMHEAILLSLPTEWPEDLVEYRNPADPHKAIDFVPEDRVEEVAKLWFADETRHCLKTEKLERAKAAAILAVMEAVDGPRPTL
jgi:predicted subunit of tRNA(5-methylaminomethyl-2-thiouridylate) methyltransferase